jgi:predicted TIM-barrel fold metal-dependent hydrolase
VPDRIAPPPVVDTETHVFLRAWPLETSPQSSPVDPYTRTDHSGALLVAEMDRAGVDAAILIGYDGYDFVDFMRRFGSVPADFMGGRGYTRAWAERYPGRLHYVTTLEHPRDPNYLGALEAELDAGAVGVKIFPAYLRLEADAPEIRAAFDLVRERARAAVFGFEDTLPPRTPPLRRLYEGIGRLAADYPDVPIQLNHGGNADPFGDDVRVLFEVAAAHPTVLVSTSVLGGVLMEWSDEWRYPFPEYLRRLAVYAEGVPPGQLAWATDWPWFEGFAKYPQYLQAVVDHGPFADDEARRGYVGANAARHWRLTMPEGRSDAE